MQLLSALFFALPLFGANMAPVLTKKVPFLDYPVDAGAYYKGRRLLGSHKTVRGYFFGVLAGVLIGVLQVALFRQFAGVKEISLFEYEGIFPILLGGLMGLGALAGDSAKSFLKRRVGRPSGSAWPLWDQLDFIVGGLVFAAPLFIPDIGIILTLFLITPLLHYAVNWGAYGLGMKDVPW